MIQQKSTQPSQPPSPPTEKKKSRKKKVPPEFKSVGKNFSLPMNAMIEFEAEAERQGVDGSEIIRRCLAEKYPKIRALLEQKEKSQT